MEEVEVEVEEEEVFPFLNYTDSLYSKKYSIYKKNEIKNSELFVDFKNKIKIANVSSKDWNKMAISKRMNKKKLNFSQDHNKLVSEGITFIYHFQNDIMINFHYQEEEEDNIKQKMKFNLKLKLKEINNKIEENMLKFKKEIKKNKINELDNQKKVTNSIKSSTTSKSSNTNKELKLNEYLNYFSSSSTTTIENENFNSILDEKTKNYFFENSNLNFENEDLKKNSIKSWNKIFLKNNNLFIHQSDLQSFFKEILKICNESTGSGGVGDSRNKIKNLIVKMRNKYSKEPEILKIIKSISNIEYNIYTLRYLDFDIFIEEILTNEEFLNKIIKISKYCPNWNLNLKYLKLDDNLLSIFKIENEIEKSKKERKKNLEIEIEIGYEL